jgi:hypothetical protein
MEVCVEVLGTISVLFSIVHHNEPLLSHYLQRMANTKVLEHHIFHTQRGIVQVTSHTYRLRLYAVVPSAVLIIWAFNLR